MNSHTLADGRQLLVREQRVKHSRWWLVFLPGSSAEYWDLDWRESRCLFSAFPGPPIQPNLLIINKPGVLGPGRVRRSHFERSFRRETRVSDYLHVMKARIPTSHQILLMGFSEGAYLAPEVANGDSRVRALSLISGGTRSWLDEEIYKCHPRLMGLTLKKVGAVYRSPLRTQPGWFGLSHATWISYDNDRTYQHLKELRLPILTQHGATDRMIDLESTWRDLDELKEMHGKNIVSKIYPNVDHTLEGKWLTALRTSSEFFARHMRRHDKVARNSRTRVKKQHGVSASAP